MKTKKEKIYLTLIGLFLLAIAVVVLLSLLSPHDEAVPAVTPRPEVTPRVVVKEVENRVEVEKVITADIVEDGLRDMGVLITGEYYFTEVMSYQSVKHFMKTDLELPFTESSYLATYDGVVLAGVDLSLATVEKDDEAKKVTVHLPAAGIRSIDIDPNSFTLHSEKVWMGNPLSVEDFNNSLVELEETAREKAVERGLLERADEAARSVISQFIGGLLDGYTLEFVTE